MLNELFNLDSFDSAALQSALADPALFYREFRILKRSGGYRAIKAPYPFLLNIQNIISTQFFSNYIPPDYVYGFVSGRSAIDHAKHHIGSNHLLTVDIENFFPNITRQMVFEAFESLGCSVANSNILSRLCTLEGSLPQGACTSPTLSNIVFESLDRRLEGLARSLDLNYSRYADDLVFSGDFIPPAIIRTIKKILATKGFQLNANKTKLKVAKSKRIITGVSISGNIPRAPKTFKRSLRAEVHRLEQATGNLFAVYGADPLVYERVLGRLNYLLQIEPGNKYALEKKSLLLNAHRAFLSKAGQEVR